jgi:alpha-L-fucosidase 2
MKLNACFKRMDNFITNCLLLLPVLFFTKTEAQEVQQNMLYYTKPATTWFEALPLGNGRLGAMVYGNTLNETIQLNESTIWAGSPYRNDNPLMKAGIGEIRQMIFNDDFANAEDAALQKMISQGAQGMPYQTAGELKLFFPGHENSTGYSRGLSLDIFH